MGMLNSLCREQPSYAEKSGAQPPQYHHWLICLQRQVVDKVVNVDTDDRFDGVNQGYAIGTNTLCSHPVRNDIGNIWRQFDQYWDGGVLHDPRGDLFVHGRFLTDC